MKALISEAYNKLVYKDMPAPEPKVIEVLIRVIAAGICGSDVHGWIQHPAPGSRHLAPGISTNQLNHNLANL